MEGGSRIVKPAAVGTLSIAAALLWAPTAAAEPEVPVDPPAPLAIAEVAPAEAVPPADPLAVPSDAVAVSLTPPEGIPHLFTPDNLPPGATQVETRSTSTRDYLKDVWEAVRSGDVTTGEALLLIAQRPMDSKGALQNMTPQQSTLPGATPVPAAEAVLPAAEAAPPAEVPPSDLAPSDLAPSDPALTDPVPPLPLPVAP